MSEIKIIDKKNIAVIGEVLFDCFSDGTNVIGGAPFNFAMNLHYLGLKDIDFYSTIGDDTLGKEVLDSCNKKLCTKNIRIIEGTTAKVIISKKKKNDSFLIPRVASFDAIDFTIKDSIIYFGSLAMRSNHNFKNLKECLKKNNIFICDLNLRAPFFNDSKIKEIVSISDILKVNRDEFDVLTKIYCYKSKELPLYLIENMNIRILIVTNGENGGEVYTSSEEYTYVVKKAKSISTVGAGDSFFAGFMYGLITKRSIDESIEIAKEISLQVCQNTHSYLK